MSTFSQATRREAEDFHRLYKSGADVERLRADIDVSQDVIDFWTVLRDIDGNRMAAESLRKMVPFRAEVLRRFNCLVAGIDDREPEKRPGNSKGDKFSVVDGEIKKVKTVLPRLSKLDALAASLGVEQKIGELYSEFRRRVSAAELVSLTRSKDN